MWETWVRSLDGEDSLEKWMATHSSILAWSIPWTKEPSVLQCMGSQRIGHDWVTLISSVQPLSHIQLFANELQHARPPCSSPIPRAYSDSGPLSWWCHPTISCSVIPFSSRFLSFPASVSFQMSQLFESGGQNIGVSASASVLPVNIQGWFPLGLISLQSKGLSAVFYSITFKSINSSALSLHHGPTFTFTTWLLEKP